MRRRAHPRQGIMASSGIGTPPHMAGELFSMMAGISIVHVPYRSAMPALADLLGARVDFMFATMPAAIGYVRAGRQRAIAVTTAARSKALPDTPALAEILPGYEASSFFGIGAPFRTLADIISELNSEVNAALADSKIKVRFEATDSVLLGGTPGQFGELIANETRKWGKVVKFAGLKPK
ncbi:tripartite tricarboxylate transporter substrate-binding protein [Bradyrhizobium sp.]|uniref:tripartite tricarboxylate transporter substrate-binding protein n=1 Tax=Bradyrhizobium sp. TaxID=376 RepID=UPI003C55A746